MSTLTTNYGLKKPGSSDYYNIADANDNMDILDTSIKGLADDKVDKAGAVTSVNSAVGDVLISRNGLGMGILLYNGGIAHGYNATVKGISSYAVLLIIPSGISIPMIALRNGSVFYGTGIGAQGDENIVLGGLFNTAGDLFAVTSCHYIQQTHGAVNGASQALGVSQIYGLI